MEQFLETILFQNKKHNQYAIFFRRKVNKVFGKSGIRTAQVKFAIQGL